VGVGISWGDLLCLSMGNGFFSGFDLYKFHGFPPLWFMRSPESPGSGQGISPAMR